MFRYSIGGIGSGAQKVVTANVFDRWYYRLYTEAEKRVTRRNWGDRQKSA
jgi:hypothetical protein